MTFIRLIITIAVTFLLSNNITAYSNDYIPNQPDNNSPDTLQRSAEDSQNPTTASSSFSSGFSSEGEGRAWLQFGNCGLDNDDNISNIMNDISDGFTTPVSYPSSLHEMSATEAAESINSIAFLRHLVGRKSTSDEVYYQSVTGGDGCGDDNDDNVGMTRSPSTTSICEYTGRLWFMKNSGGIRFRETIWIQNDNDEHQHDGGTKGEEGHSSTMVECLTAFRRSNDGDWINCSRVVCTFTKASTVEVDGEILLPRTIPMFGMGGAVKEKIIQTFRSATVDFLGGGGRIADTLDKR